MGPSHSKWIPQILLELFCERRKKRRRGGKELELETVSEFNIPKVLLSNECPWKGSENRRDNLVFLFLRKFPE